MTQALFLRLCSCAALAAATPVWAAVPGVVETFQTGLGGWGSNPSVITHRPSNGADGALDGFASVEDAGVATQLLIRATSISAPAFNGDFLAAGITGVSFALNELAIDEGLGIRFGFGSRGNFWVSNQIFDPRTNTWDSFSIDLIEANFTQVFSGTFAAAMSNVTRIQLRHDIGTPNIMPDLAQGDFGVDNIALIPSPGSVVIVGVTGVLFRRRR